MKAALTAFLSGVVPELEALAWQLGDAERESLRHALLHVLGDGKRALLERIGAGTALAVLGDPRIEPLAPEMLLIPSGPFRMGMREEEAGAVARAFDLPVAWLAKACPQHEVFVDAFELGRFPVTNGEWAHFLARSGHGERLAHFAGARAPRGRENHPVHGISPDEMRAYCDWLSRETGLRYRLPTEIEWERAARGVDARAYPWGACFDAWRANTREAGVGDTTPVGAFPDGAAACGALDMGGNVEECTGSLYRLYPCSPITDAREGTYFVSRGGSHALDADLARCDRRHRVAPEHAVGFRLARSRAAAGEVPA